MEAGLIFQLLFSSLLIFWYHKKAHIFPVTHVECYSWNMSHLEDIGENIAKVEVTAVEKVLGTSQ